MQAVRILWRAEHELRRFVELLLAAQLLDLAEDEAGIAVQFARYRLEQRPGVGGLLVGGDPRLGQRKMTRAQPLGGAHPAGFLFGAIEQKIHPRLVVARGQQRAEQIECGGLGVFRHAVAAPGIADQPLGIGAIAAPDHHLRQREFALGRDRRFILEPRPHRGVVAVVVPEGGLDAPAHEGLRRPARIGRNEGAIAFDGSAIVVAAQDQPFGELAGDRIRYRGLRLRRIGSFALAHELDDAFQRILVGLRRRRCRGHGCWRHVFAGRGQRRMLARRRRQGWSGWSCCRGAGRFARCGIPRGGYRRRHLSGRLSRLGNDVAGNRPRLRQWNFRLGPGIHRQGGQADRQRQTCRQCGRSQCGCADGAGHGFPLRRRIIHSLKP